MSDDERPLTPQGIKKFRRAARGLARLVRKPDAILTSPLPRAQRTAEIAAAAWGRTKPADAPALAGGRFEDWEALLAGYGSGARVALVGHEPHLSGFLARLIGAPHPERLTFKKGGVAIVDVNGSFADGGQLVAFLKPKVLRALAGVK